MTTATVRKLRPPIKRHGGKAYLARRIVALMPPHRAYCEPFLGGGSVLLNKPPAPDYEVAGDADAGLVNFWRVLASDRSFPGLAAAIPYAEGSFREAATWDGGEARQWALRYLVRNRFSRGELGESFAWSDRLRGGQPGDVNAWDTIRAELPRIAERVRDVAFRHGDAVPLLLSHDGPETLTYCDPPYLHETRTARDAYDHEMTREQHETLLDALLACRGVVMLSGYRSPLYDDRLAGWHRVEWDMPNHAGQGASKQRRVECLWSNRPPAGGAS